MGLTGESHNGSGFLRLGISVPKKILAMAIPPELQRRFNRITCHTPKDRMLGNIESGERDKGEVQFDCGVTGGIKGWLLEVQCSPVNSHVVRRGFGFSMRKKKLMEGTGKNPPMLPAGVEYLEFDMKEDESSPPRSVEEFTTRRNSRRLFSGRLKPGGCSKISIWRGGLRSEGGGLLFWGLGLALSATQSAL